MSKESLYKVIFQNNNQVYELFARQIYQSELYGFIEVEEYVFHEKSAIVVDPTEQKLKTEFAGVKRSFVPLHAIIRIDEVEKEGSARMEDLKGGSNVTRMPFLANPAFMEPQDD